jgi:hypothetical protein
MERLPELERIFDRVVVGIKANELRQILGAAIIKAGLGTKPLGPISFEWNRSYGGYYVSFAKPSKPSV